jgi:hypothetical protein
LANRNKTKEQLNISPLKASEEEKRKTKMSAPDLEQQPLPSATVNSSTAPPHHSPTTTAREVLRHFLHPNGKRVHVAHSPEEAVRLRKTLQRDSAAATTGPEEEGFDVVLSGTREHLETLRYAQNHHENQREELRERHQVRVLILHPLHFRICFGFFWVSVLTGREKFPQRRTSTTTSQTSTRTSRPSRKNCTAWARRRASISTRISGGSGMMRMCARTMTMGRVPRGRLGRGEFCCCQAFFSLFLLTFFCGFFLFSVALAWEMD